MAYWGDTPKWLYVQLPNSQKERIQLQLYQLNSGPLYTRDSVLAELGNKNFDPALYATKLNVILGLYPSVAQEIKRIDDKLNKIYSTVSYMPLIGKYGQCFVAFDKQQRQIVEALPTDQCKD